jgi:multisubunit Na+/H+ antiporter MnhE subunit
MRAGFPISRPGNRDSVRRVGWWIFGWVVLGALWLLYQGEWNAVELYAAASAAALSVVVAFAVWGQALPAARVERRWLVRAGRIPWRVVREFGLITVFLVRQPRGEGEFRRLSFPAGGARPAERGRRAFVALATGYSPNSYVLDVDDDENVALVHVLSRVPEGQEMV